MAETYALILSDDAEARQLDAYMLKQHGLDAVTADLTPARADQEIVQPPDLVIIDVHSALNTAIALCQHLRPQIVNPILLLTYVRNEPDILRVYEAGADECIAKPIGQRLFLAKATAWLRRSWNVPAAVLDVVQAAGLRLDPAERHLDMPDGRTVHLTNLEFRLMHLLMSHPGQVFHGDDIVRRVWGYGGEPDSSLIKHLVYRVRRKVEPMPDHPRYVQTEGGGYRIPRQ